MNTGRTLSEVSPLLVRSLALRVLFVNPELLRTCIFFIDIGAMCFFCTISGMKKTPKKTAKGRPRGATFTEPIHMKLTVGQLASWTAAAEARNMGLSVWIRDVVDQHLAAGGK